MGSEKHSALPRGARGIESGNCIAVLVQDLHPAGDRQSPVGHAYPTLRGAQGVEGRRFEPASRGGPAEGGVMFLAGISVVFPRRLKEVGLRRTQPAPQGFQRRLLS